MRLILCKDCGEWLGTENFHPSHIKAGTKSIPCKKHSLERLKKWQAANPEKHKKWRSDWGKKNRPRLSADMARWYAKNRDEMQPVTNERNVAKRGTKIPAFADRAAIREFYVEARRLTKETGVEHHVDHIIPLKGRFVCGLHIETNLQILTASKNLQKHNKMLEAGP